MGPEIGAGEADVAELTQSRERSHIRADLQVADRRRRRQSSAAGGRRRTVPKP